MHLTDCLLALPSEQQLPNTRSHSPQPFPKVLGRNKHQTSIGHCKPRPLPGLALQPAQESTILPYHKQFASAAGTR